MLAGKFPSKTIKNPSGPELHSKFFHWVRNPSLSVTSYVQGAERGFEPQNIDFCAEITHNAQICLPNSFLY